MKWGIHFDLTNKREKVEEILSSNSHSEKDLSSEGMASEALAPKQSIDMLASEIEELTGGAIPKESYTVTFAAEAE